MELYWNADSGLLLMMPSISWAQDDDLEFETVRLEEDPEAQAEPDVSDQSVQATS